MKLCGLLHQQVALNVVKVEPIHFFKILGDIVLLAIHVSAKYAMDKLCRLTNDLLLTHLEK